MKSKDKELLYNDLSARLPHHVKIQIPDIFHPSTLLIQELTSIDVIDGEVKINDYGIDIRYVKPYLRKKSSMTYTELNTYRSLQVEHEVRVLEMGGYETVSVYNDTWESLDYLNSINVDYRGLIGELALEASPDMYN